MSSVRRIPRRRSARRLIHRCSGRRSPSPLRCLRWRRGCVFGQTVTFTATVSPVPPGAGTPSGTVIFTVDGTTTLIATLDTSGTATVSTDALAAGSHTIEAAYAGRAEVPRLGRQRHPHRRPGGDHDLRLQRPRPVRLRAADDHHGPGDARRPRCRVSDRGRHVRLERRRGNDHRPCSTWTARHNSPSTRLPPGRIR
ncbi:Ig-like domain-containing protein [Streptomyces marispadix]|uniref:Ig-like domain-containing protein n=1 Tax=Streptomyces marispadix TaxID=2922868 RepID=UPI0035583C3C